MEKKMCEIVGDLMPLYVDDVCSEKSKQLIERHLEECETCKQLLETMKLEVNIPTNKEQSLEDVKIIKKVKKRIWIERIVIAVLVLIVTGSFLFGALLRLAGTYKNMNDVVNMESVSIEEDENGNLWLLRAGNASMASYIMPEVYTKDGQPVRVSSKKIYNKLKDNESYEIRIVFEESPINYYVQKLLGIETAGIEEKSMFLSKKKVKKYGKIVMEQKDGTKKVLWEKEQENGR